MCHTHIVSHCPFHSTCNSTSSSTTTPYPARCRCLGPRQNLLVVTDTTISIICNPPCLVGVSLARHPPCGNLHCSRFNTTNSHISHSLKFKHSLQKTHKCHSCWRTQNWKCFLPPQRRKEEKKRKMAPRGGEPFSRVFPQKP
jgi:hypothetical protein